MGNPTQKRFPGFEPLTANYVYCPNQFFDVCLPHCSRGAVRIVAYILRQTLGWLDHDGKPLQQRIRVTYRDLIQEAGVSRGAIGPALQEAVAAGFIECRRSGLAKAAGQSSQTAEYSLRWDKGTEYVKSTGRFKGFYTGEGHRTPIPNAFFDRIVSGERLAVVKVIGAVLRHTVGYQSQFGGRRSAAPLSFSYIQEYAGLPSRAVVSEAMTLAQQRGYIRCVKAGEFHFTRSRRQPAHYAVRWLTDDELGSIGSKREPADRFKKRTSNGSKTEPAERFKNRTKEKTTHKDINKQQAVVVGEYDKTILMLTGAGFDQATAVKLAKRNGADVIERQIAWLDHRNPRDNRLGLLHRAIEDDWCEPNTIKQKERRQAVREREHQAATQEQREDLKITMTKKARLQRKQHLLAEWGSATTQQREAWIRRAVNAETSAMIASILRKERPETMNPHVHILNVVAAELQLPPVSLVAKGKV